MKLHIILLTMMLFGLAFAATQGPPPGSPTPVSSCGTLSPAGYYQLTTNLDAEALVSGETCINITEPYTYLDLDGYTLSGSIAQSNSSSIYITASNATVANGMITNSRNGISVEHVENITLYNITFSPFNTSGYDGVDARNITYSVFDRLNFSLGSRGVFLGGDSSNVDITNSVADQVYVAFVSDSSAIDILFENNTVHNSDYGFSVGSTIVTFINNTVTNSYLAMQLYDGDFYTLYKTNFTGNYQAFSVSSTVASSINHDIGDSTIDGKNIYYDPNCQSDLDFDSGSNAGMIWFVDCDYDLTVHDLSLEYTPQPILLVDSNGSLINISNITINNSEGRASGHDSASVFISLPSSSQTTVILDSSVIGNSDYLNTGNAIIVDGLGSSISLYITDNTIRSYETGLSLSEVFPSLSSISDNTFWNNFYHIQLDYVVGLSFNHNAIYNDGSFPMILPDFINGRPSSTRFPSNQLTMADEWHSIGTIPPINCADLSNLYRGSIGVVGDGASLFINDTNISGLDTGYFFGGAIVSSTISNLEVSNVNDAIILINALDVDLSNVITSTRPTQPMTDYQCNHFIDLIFKNAYNVTLDHVVFDNSEISGDLLYYTPGYYDCTNEYCLPPINYDGFITFDDTALPAVAPYGTWMGEIINISMYVSLPNQTSSGVKNTTTPINFTMHYIPSGVVESSIKAYEHNSSDWIDLLAYSYLDEVNNQVDLMMPNLSSVFALFANSTDDDGCTGKCCNGGCEDPEISIEVDSSCDGNIVTITIDGEPVEGVAVLVDGDFIGYTDSNGQVKFDGCGKEVIVRGSDRYYDTNSNYEYYGNSLTYYDVTDYQPTYDKFKLIDCDQCGEEETGCNYDEDCEENESCEQGECVPVDCDCGVIDNHECYDYECCADSECGPNEVCTSNTCTEQEDECATDADCADNEVCTNGNCEALQGCGLIQNHQLLLYECGDEPNCPICPLGVCLDHICYEGDITCESGRVGDESNCDTSLDEEPCALCDYTITDPLGNTYNGVTDSQGNIAVPLKYEGTYKVALLKAGAVVKTTDIISGPKPQLIDEPEPSAGSDSSLLSLWWVPIVLLLGGALAYFALHDKKRKRK